MVRVAEELERRDLCLGCLLEVELRGLADVWNMVDEIS